MDIEKTDIYQKKTYGYYHFRIPALAITKKGTILAACEARKWHSDWATQSLMLRRSNDKGKSWETMQKLAEMHWKMSILDLLPFFKKKQREIVNNPLFIIDQDGETIHFLYMKNYAQCFYRYSRDEGITWSVPTEITYCFESYRKNYDWNVIAVGPGKGIQLENGKFHGRLIVPIWLAYGKGRAHTPNIAGVIYSDDHGLTWKPGDLIPMTDQMQNLNECYAVELPNGKVLLNIRNESHRKTGERYRLIATSDDGAHNWNTPTFDRGLYEPVCMGSLVRYNIKTQDVKEQTMLLFSNPCSENLGKRENLTIKVSLDNHKTWKTFCVLELGPAAYSDLAIAPNGDIYCLYERGTKNSLSPYDKICLARIIADDLNSIIKSIE